MGLPLRREVGNKEHTKPWLFILHTLHLGFHKYSQFSTLEKLCIHHAWLHDTISNRGVLNNMCVFSHTSVKI